MSRIPRNPGSGKPPSNAPARGPGRGGAASGIPANPKPKSGPEAFDGFRPTERDAQGRFLLSPKGRDAEAVAQEALGNLVGIMRVSRYEGNRKDAALAIMNRIWGAPKETVSTENVHRVIAEKPMTVDEWEANYAPVPSALPKSN